MQISTLPSDETPLQGPDVTESTQSEEASAGTPPPPLVPLEDLAALERVLAFAWTAVLGTMRLPFHQPRSRNP